ncbi:unnamed protein product [Boreogadus saida]
MKGEIRDGTSKGLPSKATADLSSAGEEIQEEQVSRHIGDKASACIWIMCGYRLIKGGAFNQRRVAFAKAEALDCEAALWDGETVVRNGGLPLVAGRHSILITRCVSPDSL